MRGPPSIATAPPHVQGLERIAQGSLDHQRANYLRVRADHTPRHEIDIPWTNSITGPDAPHISSVVTFPSESATDCANPSII